MAGTKGFLQNGARGPNNKKTSYDTKVKFYDLIGL